MRTILYSSIESPLSNKLKGIQSSQVFKIPRYVQLELAKNRQEKRVAIITGANTGIGYLTAKNLLKAGYRVIIGCRNPIKAELAIQKLKAESKEGVDIESIKLDLADFSSVRFFAEEFKKKNLPLHLLINNAGVMNLSSDEITKDGHELHFQVNYLSHFLLVDLLLPYLTKDDPRIIFLGSLVHYGAIHLSLDDFKPKTSFDPSSGYLYSKLAVTIFAYALSSKLKPKGIFGKCW
ncbi:hypothetical protein DSO57_1036294 [Entomophthora muscae]|uniref:Uncharacterized protein n=1 Tax=Entomophthora muscae TaxID=34485 RepID=A0ACC2RDY8_9FUNG|nr:hypothetical protein DSO57_1036294 [Entomophthora muscae]